ncbi:ABC transporter permease [Streptococcus hyointestinalis]|uniref:ABC transporter permease protein n=1 Tax=Streptococcus hyointestinalis TaxID=1337 RepID=A0A380K7F5_9STRE|nr:ABC transporter permease [Streptococcus hyointestinalis]SUN60230.1 ABC transporter permease protein [Streptococcus hyointestinalis]
MKWSTIWELVKVNILYSNSNYLANIRKRQEKKQKDRFSIAKEMIKNQVILLVVMMVCFSYFLLMVDYRHYPYYLGQQTIVFAVMALMTSFSAMYSVFYESGDTKNYVYLPIEPRELFVAKVIASLGMSLLYLVPTLTLFAFAYWQITGNPFTILLGIVNFAVLSVTVLALSLLVTGLIGRYIVKSRHQKAISTALTAIASFGAFVPVLYINMTSSQLDDEQALAHITPLPYFRGFVDIVRAPFSKESLLNYWLPIAVTVLVILAVIVFIVPNYYRDTLYAKVAPSKKHPKKAIKTRSLGRLMRRHHLSTLGHASLLVQTYSVPVILGISFSGAMIRFSSFFDSRHFGVTFLVGVLLGLFMTQSASLLGVGLSLEKDNYTYLKTLPFSFKGFIKQKFWVLYGVQVLPPALLMSIATLFFGMHPVLVVSLFVGMLLSSLIQGQFIYRSDYRHLNLNWQNINQLFNRGNSQMLSALIFFVELIVGVVLLCIAIFASFKINPTIVSGVILVMSALVIASLQLLINRLFWKKLV